ncbi:AMP-binding protein [Algoriphagus sediminis]|uniref:AMP-binding protein n=1 Tax=Algoriphagus sediminis TaxID=3057113 RepID=A0ABT7YA09_9BACT|nr:AMP-binding protein [Algoriphagus sediminis]MDN3203265.1 AMP-binding protein [Algoriphagus sediminis]
MFQLRIEDKTFTKKEDFLTESSFTEPWAKATIDFCGKWLSGESEFQLRTSGSTGKPKLITVKRSQMEASAKATQSFLGTSSRSRIMNSLNPEFIAGIMNLVRAMVWRCPIFCEKPSNSPLKAPSDFQPTFITLVPSQLEGLLSQPGKLSGLKHILVGGAPTNQTLREKISESRIPAWQTFGMTETVSHFALARITPFPLKYHVLPGVEIGVSEQNNLWVKSPMSDMKVVQTNDVVNMVSPTEFYWIGRSDFVINSGGIKLHPEELEIKIQMILGNELPNRFFLFGKEDEKLGEKLCMALEDPNHEINTKEMRTKIKESLGSIQTPKEIFVLPSFVETKNGKVQRKASISDLS